MMILLQHVSAEEQEDALIYVAFILGNFFSVYKLIVLSKHTSDKNFELLGVIGII